MQRLPEQESISLLVGSARRSIKQAVGRLVRGHGVSPTQFWFLVQIAEHPGESMGALAARLRVDAPLASRVVATLVRRGLVLVAANPDDRRHACLGLTPRGKALARRLRPIALKVRATADAGLSATERRALRTALRKVVDNMRRLEQGEGAR